MRWLKGLYSWTDSRLQLGEPIKEMALHPVPNKTASWWYVFGSAAFVLLMLQILTGILPALVYVPSAATLGTVSISSITSSHLAGFYARCTAANRISWSQSC